MDVTKNGWIDISATISDGMVRWPTDAPVHIYKTEAIGKDGSPANVTAISSTAHLGTHIDAPLHFIQGGLDISRVELDAIIGPAKVIRITDGEAVKYAAIKDQGIEAGDRVLFRTHNSDTAWETEPFNENYIHLASDAAHFLADKGVRCVGIDYISIGGNDNNEEVHRALLGNSIIIIEGLKLGGVEQGSYEMVCLPLKIKGSDGSPARVIIRKV